MLVGPAVLLKVNLQLTLGAFHLTDKTGIASIANVAINGKHIARCNPN